MSGAIPTIQNNGIKPVLRLFAGIAGLGIGLAIAAAQAETPAVSPYAGEESRAVSSFSKEDMADLRAGRGWGLAKPAELNGYPGPRHVLDLRDQLSLSAEQENKIQAIFDRMQERAKRHGYDLIKHERALDNAFRNGAVGTYELTQLLQSAAATRASLRYVHLVAHLETTVILSRHQRHKYQKLRGYGAGHDGSDHHKHHGKHNE